MPSRVAVTIDGHTLPFVASASLRRDVLELAATFQLTIDPATERARALVREDAQVTITLDGIRVLTGYVGQVEARSSRGSRVLDIQGRDKAGRLVDTAMPLIRLADLDILELGRQSAGPWFTRVELSNAQNRALLRGRGPRALAGREPVFARLSEDQYRVQPGQRRAEVLRFFLAEVGLLAWSSADGQALIIAKPNQAQQPQYRLTGRTVAEARWVNTCEERGSVYYGHAQPASDFGERYRIEEQQPDLLGTFRKEKRIDISIAADNRAQLRKRLATEIARRTLQARVLECRVMDFGQRFNARAEKTLFAPDTVASVDLPLVSGGPAARGDFYVMGVEPDLGGRDASTMLRLVPVGTEVRA